MKGLFFISLVLIWSNAISQDLPLRGHEQLENIAGFSEDVIQEDDAWLQQLEYLRRHKLNLNIATKEDLQQLHLLNDLQVSNFISYRELLGKLLSIYELQAVPSWDLNTIRKILPFIYVGAPVNLKENFHSRFKGEHSLLFRFTRTLERSKGYRVDSGNRYLGDPNHLLFRYRYQYKDLLYFGLVGDKDAGEQFFKGAQSNGFDFYSFHFYARRLGVIKSLAIGDYVVNLGQGLIQWHSLGFSKGSEAVNIKRQSSTIMPYRAAGEFNFYRGAAISLGKKYLEATVFLSRKKLSATMDDSTQTFSAFQTSGYNRSVSEIADRNRIAEFVLGGNVNLRRRTFEIGLNTVLHQFDHMLQKKAEPYNRFAFAGSKIYNASIDYSYGYKNLHVFGEAAIDKNNNHAWLQGLIASVDPKVDLSLLYRNISRSYQSLNASAFTESNLPVNENGIYSGITIRPYHGWTINAYADLFRFPWIRYRIDAPASGADYLIYLSYQPNRQTELSARFRSESKPLNSVLGTGQRFPEQKLRKALRIHFSTQLNSNLLFRSRVETVWYREAQKTEEGFLGYIEMVKAVTNKIKCSSRFQYVETGGYDSRIYSYEPDVLYSFSIPAFFDKGLRYYFNLQYGFSKKIRCWLRLAQLLHTNKEEFGSDLDQVNGRRKTELKVQLLVQL